MKHLTLEDIKFPKPDFNKQEKKGQMVLNWLIDWVKNSLETGVADFGDYIPTKEELSSFLNVSPATVQIAIREAKNLGYFTSKQSLGTSINDFYSKDIKNDEFCNSTITECKIKKLIIDGNYKINEPILSIKEISNKTNISQNTIRFTLVNFERQGYLEKIGMKGNKYSWIYKKEFTLTNEEENIGIKDENFTLTHQLTDKIQNYLEKTYKQGEKIMSNQAFSNMFNVSTKTVNDAMKILNGRKVILSRRGRYGTIFLGKNQNKKIFISKERKTIPPQNYNYQWQKTLVHLKKYIVENYETGDKIAPIRQLAIILNVSPNTVRRALKDMFKDGYLLTKRGKFGGVFIVDMPEIEENYKWLAINPEVVKFNN